MAYFTRHYNANNRNNIGIVKFQIIRSGSGSEQENLFQYFWDTVKWVESHEEGSWYGFLFHALRHTGPVTHASGPTNLLQPALLMAEGLAS